MLSRSGQCLVVLLLVLPQAWSSPALFEAEVRPLSAVSELNTRLSSLSSRLQEPKLPLPTIQDLEAIKKVAQILIMLGEQVIPGIIGEAPAPPSCDPPQEDVPNDPVADSLKP